MKFLETATKVIFWINALCFGILAVANWDQAPANWVLTGISITCLIAAIGTGKIKTDQ